MTGPTALTTHRAAIEQAAHAHRLPSDLVTAIVWQESHGNTGAWNPEPRYRWFWDVRLNRPFRTVSGVEVAKKFPPADFPTLAGDRDQEWWAQQASWGLMQIMGAVAREHGCRNSYLTDLCRLPDLNVALGCKHLAQLLAWADGDVGRALAAYNGGKAGNATPPYRNADYANAVLEKRRALAGGGMKEHA